MILVFNFRFLLLCLKSILLVNSDVNQRRDELILHWPVNGPSQLLHELFEIDSLLSRIALRNVLGPRRRRCDPLSS